jgi:hypothetical protein
MMLRHLKFLFYILCSNYVGIYLHSSRKDLCKDVQVISKDSFSGIEFQKAAKNGKLTAA